MSNKIDGYRELPDETVEDINYIKSMERDLASFWRIMASPEHDTDKRELALAKTHFEEGFMHFVKALAKPQSAW